MNQISSIGRKLQYDKVYNDKGKLKDYVINGKELYNSSFIRDDIINLLREDPTGLFQDDAFRCGDDIENLEAPGSVKKIFDGLDEHVLNSTCVKIEKETWNIDTDKPHTTQVSTGNCKAKKPNEMFCPRPKALCKVNPADSTCETQVLEPGKTSPTHIASPHTRADIGFKVKLALRIFKYENERVFKNKKGEDIDINDLNKLDRYDPKLQAALQMQCNMDRVFSFAPDVTPIKFKELVTVKDESPIGKDMKCDNNHKTTLSPPGVTPEKKIYGASCIFYDNVDDGDGGSDCGKLSRRLINIRTLTATFETTDESPELPASVFYCKIEYKTFKNASDETEAVPDGNSSLDKEDWNLCHSMKVGSIKDIRIMTVTKDGFKMEFDYDPKIDADHRIHLVAVDPAGNVSEIKRINFASKYCYDYRNHIPRSDSVNGAINCGVGQWCSSVPRSPWRNLADVPDVLDANGGNIYDHRKTGDKCRYYKIVENNYNVPLKWNKFGCDIGSCCPNSKYTSCPNQICNNPDTNCYDGCSFDIKECNHHLDDTHFDMKCTPPNSDSCKQINPFPSCSCTRKTNAPLECGF